MALGDRNGTKWNIQWHRDQQPETLRKLQKKKKETKWKEMSNNITKLPRPE